MRILKLRFRNLNSLAGEWLVDFSHPDYSANGLFAITGPTGVGKTTILDAICLALYGATPRLDKISQSSNEIMSRGCGECLAEVIFETSSGRYRCQWSQHRSRQKADGKLQAARHEIVDDQNNQVIESHLTKTLAEVEKVTGMNFGQFTRSIMLAQGAFAAFLEAPPAERAELLEQITGTGIYSEISQRVQQRESREKAAFKEIEKKLGEAGSDQADIAELNREKNELTEISQRLEEQWRHKNEQFKKLENLNALKAAQAQLAQRTNELEALTTAMAPKRVKLELARKAQTLAADQALLKQHRLALGKAVEDSAKLDLLLKQLAGGLTQAVQRAKTAEQELRAVKLENDQKRPLIQRALELEAELREKERHLIPLKESRDRTGQALSQKVKLNIEATFDDFERRLKDMTHRLEEKKNLFELEEKELSLLLAARTPAAWREELTAVERRYTALKDLSAAALAALEAEKELNVHRAAASQGEKDLINAEEKLSLAGRLLAASDKNVAKLNAELIRLRTIQSLAGHRQELTEGSPCPLCGSLEHPWADPSLRPPESIAQKEKDLREGEKDGREARLKVTAFTAEKSRLEQLLKSHHESMAALQKRLLNLASEINALREKLGLAADQLISDSEIEKSLAETSARARSISELLLKAEKKAEALKNQKDQLLANEKLTEESRRLFLEWSRLSKEAEERSGEYQKTLQNRKAVLPGLEAGKEEKRLQETLASAERKYDQERQASEKALREQKTNEDRLKDALELRERLKDEAAGLEENFRRQLVLAGFADEEAWQQALLSEEERAAWEAEERDLGEKLAALAGARQENSGRLSQLQANLPDDISITVITAELTELDREKQNLHQKIGGLDEKLNEQLKLIEKHRLLLAEFEAQKREKARWENLSRLIGSHDGQKYRNFAQGLSFALVVRQANLKLAELTDRYLLACDARRPLELNVIDNYQGGEERSTRNLSGGESFIISLALALGLSQMASRRVRVDSLFLDEGFGTLDEDSLETVLETLSGLREGGKLIGLISHIPALTERIPVQIKLRPVKGPFSAISGPGVSGSPSRPVGPAIDF